MKVTDSELMTIGEFAQKCGLSASALRFYSDTDLLNPIEVDSTSGYRLYSPEQLQRAVLMRRLRVIGIPLNTVRAILAAPPDEANNLIDEYLNAMAESAEEARGEADAIKADLLDGSSVRTFAVSGPVLATAFEQVISATIDEPKLAVLGGIRLAVGTDAIGITATDRYRLTQRTLTVSDSSSRDWAVTVHGGDLRNCLAELRRWPSARIDVTDSCLRMRSSGRIVLHCRLLSDSFPEFEDMMENLSAPSTRVEMPKTALLQCLERRSSDVVLIRVVERGFVVQGGPGDVPTEMSARIEGDTAEVWFEMTTLYPAIATAIGAEVLIDFRGSDQPATIRSADYGDLTTIVMPTRPPDADSVAGAGTGGSGTEGNDE